MDGLIVTTSGGSVGLGDANIIYITVIINVKNYLPEGVKEKEENSVTVIDVNVRKVLDRKSVCDSDGLMVGVIILSNGEYRVDDKIIVGITELVTTDVEQVSKVEQFSKVSLHTIQKNKY